MRAAPPRLLVAQRHGLDAADQVRQRGVEHQVFQRGAVRRADQLHAALGNGAGGGGFQFGADLVNDDHFGHMVFHCLDHHGVLTGGAGHLHSAGPSDRGVRNVAVAGDFVAGVHDDNALAEVVAENAGHFAQQRRLAHAGRPQQQDAFARLDQVADDVDRAIDRPPDAAGQPDNIAGAVADARDAVQRALDTGAVVFAEMPDALGDIVEILAGHVHLTKQGFAVAIARFGSPTQVQHDLDQVGAVVLRFQGPQDGRRQSHQDLLQVIGNFLFAVGAAHQRVVAGRDGAADGTAGEVGIIYRLIGHALPQGGSAWPWLRVQSPATKRPARNAAKAGTAWGARTAVYLTSKACSLNR